MEGPRENLKKPERKWRKKNRKAVAEETKCGTYLCMHKNKAMYKEPRRKRLLGQRRR